MKYLSITQRLSFVVVLLFQVLLLQAAGLIREVTVTEAGTLSTLIPASEKMEITDLKVSGSINGADIKYICEMAGLEDYSVNKNAKLYNLDLKDANIVDGGLEGSKWVSQKDALGYTDDNQTCQAGFRGCYSLRKIAIPSTVSHLYLGALASCQNLSNVVISSSEISYCDNAISSCNIDTLSFLSSGKMKVTPVSVDTGVLLGGTSLNAVKIEAAELAIRGRLDLPNNTLKSVSIKTSGDATLSGFFTRCYGLTSLSINVGGKLMDGDYSSHVIGGTFSACTSLETFELKAANAHLYGTFDACVNLKSFNIDVSENLQLVYTFAQCSSLDSVDFGLNKNVFLGSNTFQDCKNLRVVKGNLDYSCYFLNGNYGGAFGNCPSLKSVEGLGGNITPYAFDGCTSLDSLVITDAHFYEKSLAGSSLKKIIINGNARFEENAFAGASTLPTIVNNGRAGFSQNTFAEFQTPPTIINNGNVLLYGCFRGMNIPEYTFDKGEWRIGDGVFDSCGLKNIQVGSECTLHLESGAFSGCKDLEALDIKCRKVSIDSVAFSNSGLKSLSIGCDKLEINKEAFNTASLNNSVLKSLSIDCDDIEIEKEAFKATTLSNLSISNRNGIIIGKEAFADCQNLKCEFQLNGDIKIGEYAFEGFKGTSDLSSLTIDSPKSISIGCGAFADWDKLQTLKISGTEVCLGTHEYDVEVAPVFKGAPLSSLSIDCDKIALEDNVFEGHADLAELSFKAKNASLRRDVFKDCPKLSSLQFDCDTISFYRTFTDNMDLTAVTINSHNIEFGYDSFKGCRNLKSLIFTADKEGDYVRIYENAFSDCSGLTSVVLPSSVSGIGKSAFSGCISLTSVKVAWQKPLQIYYYDNDYVVKKGDAFEDSSRETCTLYVPRGTKEAYQADSVWGKFGTIVEYDVTGIDKVTTAKDAKELSRYSANGQRLTAPTKGLNIVKYSDGSVRKEMVK